MCRDIRKIASGCFKPFLWLLKTKQLISKKTVKATSLDYEVIMCLLIVYNRYFF